MSRNGKLAETLALDIYPVKDAKTTPKINGSTDKIINSTIIKPLSNLKLVDSLNQYSLSSSYLDFLKRKLFNKNIVTINKTLVDANVFAYNAS